MKAPASRPSFFIKPNPWRTPVAPCKSHSPEIAPLNFFPMIETDQSVQAAAPATPLEAAPREAAPHSAAPPPAQSFWQPPWFSLCIILFGPMMTVLDVFIVNVGLPTIQTYFHTTNAQVQLVVASYLVGYAVFLVMGSRLGDHFGRKRLFWIGLVFFTLTSAG